MIYRMSSSIGLPCVFQLPHHWNIAHSDQALPNHWYRFLHFVSVELTGVITLEKLTPFQNFSRSSLCHIMLFLISLEDLLDWSFFPQLLPLQYWDVSEGDISPWFFSCIIVPIIYMVSFIYFLFGGRKTLSDQKN